MSVDLDAVRRRISRALEPGASRPEVQEHVHDCAALLGEVERLRERPNGDTMSDRDELEARAREIERLQDRVGQLEADWLYLRDGQHLAWSYLTDRDDVPYEVKVVVNHLMFARDATHTQLDEAVAKVHEDWSEIAWPQS